MSLPIAPVTDRIKADADYANANRESTAAHKGVFNYVDWNRIETNRQYLADALNAYGYYVEIQTKTDWAETDFPNRSQVDRIRSNIEALISCYHRKEGSPEIRFENTLGWEDANSLEQNLENIDQLIGWMVDGFRYSGTFHSGQEVILP